MGCLPCARIKVEKASSYVARAKSLLREATNADGVARLRQFELMEELQQLLPKVRAQSSR